MEEEIKNDTSAVSGRNCVQVEQYDVPNGSDERKEQTDVKGIKRRDQNLKQCNGREESKPELLRNIPDPPSDWKLNNLLDEISMKVDGDQLERFKGLFRGHGPGSIGKGTLEKCTSCIKFFQILKEREFISRDNLIYVQKFLHMLDNRELIEQMIEYCRKEGKLYFYKAQEEPEPGHRNVKFHLVGRDITNYEPNKQQAVRDRVAEILCIPVEQIRIIGVGPVSSLCITLMIPETYVAIFQDMLERKLQFKRLCDLNIDLIYIEERVYNITGVEDVEIIETEQQRKIMCIYDQYQEKSKLLEKTESRMLDLQAELDVERTELIKSKSKLMELDIVVNTYESMHKDADIVEEDEFNFRKELSATHIPNALREPVKRLLESNTIMVKNYSRKSNRNEVMKLQLDFEEQKRTVFDLQRQLDIHRYLSYRSVSEVNLLETLRMCLKDIPLEQFEKYIEVIKALGSDLKKDEISTIQADYDSTQHEEIKRHMQESPNLFLIGIICMEYNKDISEVDIEQFICKLLKKVKRDDLLKKFEEKINELKLAQNARNLQVFQNSTFDLAHTVQAFFGRFDRYPRLISTRSPHIQQGQVTVSTFHSLDMLTRPFKSFVLRSIQTLHFL